MDSNIGAAAGPKPPRRVQPSHESQRPIIAIIGAGFSGTMAAIHLRHALPADHVIYLLDRTGRFARGPAYAASTTPHLLNVRSVNMSALPDDPRHFERWLSDQSARLPLDVATTEAGIFATRRLYGRYLRALLYQEMTESGGRVRLGAQDVTGVTRTAEGWRLHCRGGCDLIAAGLVMAIGNLPSRQACGSVIYHDPWSQKATADLRPDEPVLIVGTGLTMIDLALGMRTRGFDGPIIAVSRRGLVPQPHAAAGGAWPCPDFSAEERHSLTQLMRRLRQEVRLAASQGVGWTAVIDGLRPATAALWQGLPETERNRFLRHVRPYWDTHRHRMAPVVATRYGALIEDGSLVVMRGRVQQTEVDGVSAQVHIQSRGSAALKTLTVQRVIYATGIGAGAETDGLVSSLMAQGYANTDPHGMGLAVTATLEMIGADGTITDRAWALGPIVRGMFWECTAVPDIRVQARMIADGVLRQLATAP